MFLQGSLSIERMCQLVAVSRRSFYRSLQEQRPTEEAMEVRSVIQQIALEHRRRYGYRRIRITVSERLGRRRIDSRLYGEHGIPARRKLGVASSAICSALWYVLRGCGASVWMGVA
jgi:transposase InsO family protein